MLKEINFNILRRYLDYDMNYFLDGVSRKWPLTAIIASMMNSQDDFYNTLDKYIDSDIYNGVNNDIERLKILYADMLAILKEEHMIRTHQELMLFRDDFEASFYTSLDEYSSTLGRMVRIIARRHPTS